MLSPAATPAPAPSAPTAEARDVLPPPLRWSPKRDGELPVRLTGALPSWLSGTLVRAAPAVFALDGWAAEHWFDGLALLYAFELGPRLGFVQRLLASETARLAQRGESPLATFDSRMRRSFVRRLREPIPKLTDNANVNVIPWQGKWLAMTETPHQHLVDRELHSLGTYRYDDGLSGLSMTAHPQFDFARGALLNVGTALGARSELVVYRQERDSRTRIVEGRLACKRVPYVHSFGASPGHVVLIDHPLRVNPLQMLFSNRGAIEHYKWEPSRGCFLWKLERASGRLTRYETEPMFCFHTVHQFEDGADVVLDLLVSRDASLIGELRTERLVRAFPCTDARLVRARLAPGKSEVQLEPLSSQRFEFPQIAYRARQGVRHRAVWGAALDFRREPSSEIVRIDLEGDRVTRFAEQGFTFGEPVFVARPDGATPEDGVLLSVGSSATSERSQLVVLDATHLEPLARVEVDAALPLGFHGNFERSEGA